MDTTIPTQENSPIYWQIDKEVQNCTILQQLGDCRYCSMLSACRGLYDHFATKDAKYGLTLMDEIEYFKRKYRMQGRFDWK